MESHVRTVDGGCVWSQAFDALALVVKSEEKGSEILLESKIQMEDIYQLQQGEFPVFIYAHTSSRAPEQSCHDFGSMLARSLCLIFDFFF